MCIRDRKYGFAKANVIGLVAPESKMVRRVVRGFTVVGTYSDLSLIDSRYRIDQIWFGPNLDKEHKNMVNSWCVHNGVDSISIASQPGFRKLVLPEITSPEYAEYGDGRSSKTPQSEVAA